MTALEKLLSGGDLRSVGKAGAVLARIKNQRDFDRLFKLLFHKDRLVVMRAADAIEKITIENPEYLHQHKKELINLFRDASNKELMWHLALMMPRLKFGRIEFISMWHALKDWTLHKMNSKLVRVGALQALFEMTQQRNDLIPQLEALMLKLEKEHIPSINARIRNIRNEQKKIKPGER